VGSQRSIPLMFTFMFFKADPAFQKMLERRNLKLLNILVMDDTLAYRKQLVGYPLARLTHRGLTLVG
jgi:hypothetical protein